MARQDGAALFGDLLAQPPASVARWVHEQLRDLSVSGKNNDVGQLPVTRLAAAFTSAPREQRQLLVRSAVAGLTELPAEENAEFLRMVIQCVAEAKDEPGATSNTGPPALVVNLLKVANSAQLDNMPSEVWQGLSEAAQTEASRSFRPQQLVDTVAALKPAERSGITHFLASSKLVTREQQVLLDESVKPGGHLDWLRAALVWAPLVWRGLPLLLLLPALELVMAYAAPSRGSLLVAWLRLDAFVGLTSAIAMVFTARAVRPACRLVMEDTAGVLQRGFAQAGGLKAKLKAALPGVSIQSLAKAATATGLVLALLGFSFFWSIWGLVLLPLSVLSGNAPAMAALVCSMVLCFRMGIVVCLVRGFAYVWRQFRRRERALDIPVGAYAGLQP